MVIDKSSKPVRNDDILYNELEDGSILYDTGTDRVHSINVFASYVWEYCDNKRSVQDIIEVIQGELNELKRDHTEEVLSTLEQFVKAEIVVLQ